MGMQLFHMRQVSGAPNSLRWLILRHRLRLHHELTGVGLVSRTATLRDRRNHLASVAVPLHAAAPSADALKLMAGSSRPDSVVYRPDSPLRGDSASATAGDLGETGLMAKGVEQGSSMSQMAPECGKTSAVLKDKRAPAARRPSDMGRSKGAASLPLLC